MKRCKVDGCESKSYSLGYCIKHYARYRRYGTVVDKPRGYSAIKEYKVYHYIKSRCYNKNFSHYHRYGGRGIVMCDRWLESFFNFLEDMGTKPFPKAQIDRIDNDGNYEKNNCHWTTPRFNTQHTSKTKLNMEKAKEIRRSNKSPSKKTPKELADKYGVCRRQIYSILNNKAWLEEEQGDK